MEHDNLIISRINDKLDQCLGGYYVTSTGFLDAHGQSVALQTIRKSGAGVQAVFYGGYENAERRLLLCLPLDWPIDATAEAAELICVLRVKLLGSSSRPLTHRDYLGAMLGLGLDRSISGDILVGPDGADIIVTTAIADFLAREFTQVGRAEVKCSVLPLAELIVPDQRTEILKDTVPSLRLDNIVSSAFKISRKLAAEAISGGLVSVNHIEATKPDARVDEGSTLVLRGKGKAVLLEIGGESKKGRLWIVIKRYI